MKRFYLILAIVSTLGTTAYSEEHVAKKPADEIIERLQQNPAVVRMLPDKGTTVSVELALKGSKITDDNVRASIAEYCAEVERMHPTHPQYKTRSNNYALLGEMVYCWEKNKKNSDELWNLYHPTDLDKYANRIRAKVYSTANRDMGLGMLSVYATLPSNNPGEVKNFVGKFLSAPDFQHQEQVNPVILGILARYGDTKSEDALLKYTKDCGVGGLGYDGVRDLENALVLANTTRVEKMLAEGLRPFGIIPTPGNRVITRREVYASALNRIFRDDPSYPFPNKEFLTWKEYGILETWCVEHLGIKVSTPFPDVPPTPAPTPAAK